MMRTLSLASLLLLLPGGPAAGQSAGGEPTAETPEIAALDQADLDRAEALFFEGLGHYRAGRFEQAAVAFQKAFVLTRHPDLLFNVARSRERLGDKEGAVEWYQAYLGTRPADETAVIHRIRQLGGEPRPREAPRVAAVGEVEPRVEPPRVVEKSPGPWPWVAAGASLAAVAAGTVLGLQALDEASAARAAETRPVAVRHKDAAESKALLADVSFGLGAVAAATAVYLWLRADDAAATDQRLELGVTPGGGVGVGWTGSF